jgi:hypothetical protein
VEGLRTEHTHSKGQQESHASSNFVHLILTRLGQDQADPYHSDKSGADSV